MPLVENIKGVGRIRGCMIFKAGCKTIEDVQAVTPAQLTTTGLPEETCERFITSAKEYTSIEEQDGD